jgi:protein-S-isoprenylcysteine O-methyltransferase Ste14
MCSALLSYTIVKTGILSRKMGKKDLYATHGRSLPQRLFLAATTGASLAAAWWLLFGGGILSAGEWFGWAIKLGDERRRLYLALALSIYFVRLLFTQFVFLKRAVSWGEALLIAPWLLFIYSLFAIAGGTNPVQANAPVVLGAALFLFGSWMNSYAEYDRHIWKQCPENRGRLYTLGLFRYTRHPNYLGDLILFTGLCLICGRWICVAIPLIMLAGFVFANIPMLDSHLRDRYGAAFDEYAARTARLIPFVY